MLLTFYSPYFQVPYWLPSPSDQVFPVVPRSMYVALKIPRSKAAVYRIMLSLLALPEARFRRRLFVPPENRVLACSVAS